ncbi:MAG: quinoprotein dehydrogenase-associated putative ABC transporter substrate-binding protein [Hyphomicrobium sp.]
MSFRTAVAIFFGVVWALVGAPPASAQRTSDFTKSKTFDEMTAAEHTAARNEARHRKLNVLRVCADPGNMPLSNNKLEGFQNKIADLLARSMGGHVNFFWRPYLERGLTRETFANNECDVLMDMPATSSLVLTTNPIYRTTYVLAHREDRKLRIESLDDPILKTLSIGVFQHSGLREAFARRGMDEKLQLHIISHMADLRPEEQPWRQVQRVVDGELDVAGVWGPFAGWLKTMNGAPLVIQPVNLMEDVVPMEFDLALGLRHNDVMLKYMLDWALERNKDEIAKILADYGVPLVECSRCTVQGSIPSHGSYYQKLRGLKNADDRYLKQADPLRPTDQATADQVVTTARLDEWIRDGASLEQELANAILGEDEARITTLLARGADVNKPDAQGYLPIVSAARGRSSGLVALFAAKGARVDARDGDGFTALLHAVNRNHVPTVQALAKAGADLEFAAPSGVRPLAMALGDGKAHAAKALIELGAKSDAPSGTTGVTPLMVIATQITAQSRSTRVTQGPTPLELAQLLLDRGAPVDAVSSEGVTALMIAAGHNNAPMIGLLLRAGADPKRAARDGRTALDIARTALNDDAIGALKFLTAPARKSPAN